MNLNSVGVGSLPFLRAGEKITRPGALDRTNRRWTMKVCLETEASTALNLPLSELKIRLLQRFIQQI